MTRESTGAELMRWIILGLIVWGALLGAGAWYVHLYGTDLYGKEVPVKLAPQYAALKPMIIGGCFTAFLAIWGLLLAWKAKRLRTESHFGDSERSSEEG